LSASRACSGEQFNEKRIVSEANKAFDRFPPQMDQRS